MTEGYVKTYVIDVSTSHTAEEGAHGPSWPNGASLSSSSSMLSVGPNGAKWGLLSSPFIYAFKTLGEPTGTSGLTSCVSFKKPTNGATGCLLLAELGRLEESRDRADPGRPDPEIVLSFLPDPGLLIADVGRLPARLPELW
eukprot:CAMPEP_0198204932 /NCGR_PEP_ID=MMETSP1445-20131203/8420_1 /TAXON_ID=36898 /ORGANISM="Pyramimonas sp., Strain CCMP2087" /LENGTH=140 /DNA_ID=CAMNT_0043877031 /DNA_START=180 /DNA_END=598 /DNA_ORIENTATION=-